MAVDHDALGGELFPILGQIIFAHGQGADSLYISGEALSAGAGRFSPLIPPHQDEWDTQALNVLEIARAVGRVAAHKALHQSRSTISAQDLQGATDEVLGDIAWPMLPCAFCN